MMRRHLFLLYDEQSKVARVRRMSTVPVVNTVRTFCIISLTFSVDVFLVFFYTELIHFELSVNC